VAILQTVAVTSYLCALRLTAVADVMIVYAIVPFVVAALAWLGMRERASRPTLVASAVASAGVVVMLWGAPLAALIGTLDTPLSPFWVWLAVGEVPTTAALVGGTIVLGAVVGHIVAESRRQPEPGTA
jgi:drug/metabolite transporter (DMT)-like permease